MSYTNKMKQEFSIIPDATYFGHKNEELSKYAGQLRKNGEYVVIIKNQDGTYTTIRQTTKNNTELKNYKNLEDLKNDMSSESYGWGRNSWGNIPFNIRDVSFIKNPLIEVVGHRN